MWPREVDRAVLVESAERLTDSPVAGPGTRLRTLYESRPELAHALVDVEPQLTRILAALVIGMRSTGM